jgi:undecaprenyl phosphate-alpha-L-ara4N flippase subunit ArnE
LDNSKWVLFGVTALVDSVCGLGPFRGERSFDDQGWAERFDSFTSRYRCAVTDVACSSASSGTLRTIYLLNGHRLLDAGGFAKRNQFPLPVNKRELCAGHRSKCNFLSRNDLDIASCRSRANRTWDDIDEPSTPAEDGMNPKVMIWMSVALSAIAQIFLKLGLSNLQSRTSDAGMLKLATGIVGEKFIWLWGGCFVAATGLWLSGLQQLDLSYAYPLVSVGFVLVTLLSALLFHEQVDRNRWIAVTVISAGVMLIASS